MNPYTVNRTVNETSETKPVIPFQPIDVVTLQDKDGAFWLIRKDDNERFRHYKQGVDHQGTKYWEDKGLISHGLQQWFVMLLLDAMVNQNKAIELSNHSELQTKPKGKGK